MKEILIIIVIYAQVWRSHSHCQQQALAALELENQLLKAVLESSSPISHFWT